MRASGLVLAGGMGTRMGRPKAFVDFRGAPLVRWPLRALAPLCEEVLVAAGSLQLDVPGARSVADEGGGPLSGLRAGAREAKGEWLLVAPCDAPLVTTALYRALLDLARGRDGAMVRLENRDQPLVACYRLDALRPALASAFAPRDLPRLMGLALLEDPRLAPLARDADTPDELRALE